MEKIIALPTYTGIKENNSFTLLGSISVTEIVNSFYFKRALNKILSIVGL